tara:strand:- start:270 stop:1223 length:954 start_codon:yes stop_codon:yes gene_type:complete
MPAIPIYFNLDGGGNPGLEAGGIRLAAMLENEVAWMLADMASIRRTGALRFLGDVSGSGSDAVTMRFSSLGAKTPFASADEYDDVAPTGLTTSTSTCTVSRSTLRWDISDLASMTGFGADLDPFSIAASMAQSAEARINELICSTFGSASATAGTSTAALSLDSFFDAQFALELASNTGEYYCILHPKSLSQLVDSLRGESNNALAYAPATADMLAIKGQGYAGTLLGVNIFKSAYVQKNGGLTDYLGAMMSSGGVAYAIGTPGPMVGATELRPAGSPVVVEFQRDSSNALTEIIGHLYAGCAISEQDRIVQLISAV